MLRPPTGLAVTSRERRYVAFVDALPLTSSQKIQRAALKEMAAAGVSGIVCVAGDVSKIEDCQRRVAEGEAAAGPIDILVNNAGITRDGVFHKMKPEQWSEVIRVNMDSLFNMTRQVIFAVDDDGSSR